MGMGMGMGMGYGYGYEYGYWHGGWDICARTCLCERTMSRENYNYNYKCVRARGVRRSAWGRRKKGAAQGLLSSSVCLSVCTYSYPCFLSDILISFRGARSAPRGRAVHA